jgi:hypothetical protein
VFKRFTQLPDRQPIFLKESRVQAFAATEDGTRIFLSGAFSCLVEESADEVLLAFRTRSSDDAEPS